MHLRMVINNTDDLSGGYAAIKDFDEQGGTIGADEDSTWQIVDRAGSVKDTHVVITLQDKQFCLETSIKKGLSINNAKSFIPVGELVQIRDGDTIKIGKFELTAYIELTEEETASLVARGARWARRFMSIGSLVDNRDEESLTAQNFFESKTMKGSDRINIREAKKREKITDPVTLIEENYESRSTTERDPIKLFDKDSIAEKDVMASKLGDIIKGAPEEGIAPDVPDDLQPGSAYMDLPIVSDLKSRKKKASSKMKKNDKPDNIDEYLESIASNLGSKTALTKSDLEDISTRDHYLNDIELLEEEEGELIDHVLLRPLCLAMGIPIHKMSVPKANRLLTDIGEAIKATVQGLMAAHQRELSDKSHLSQTHLHAIEDNPLRLDKSIEDVIKDMFLVNSPVHLSAAAAIGESLELIQYHEKASEVAAEEALDAVLRALGPLALAKRFKKYKGHAPRAGDLDAWHWQMYQHYYNEIRSEQQGGLGRMYWEVYSQVYDREMRKQTLEG
ncbi:type VI secretion system-associated FHA domain protein TagH [Bartonella sp. LJL80]